MIFISFEVCLKVSEKVMEFNKTNKVFAGAKHNNDLFVFGAKAIEDIDDKVIIIHEKGDERELIGQGLNAMEICQD